MATRTIPTLDDFRAAQDRLGGVARVTPVYSSETLSRLTGRKVWLKAENLQRTGSFKIRGAFNKITGIALALEAVRPALKVVGVQAAGCLPGGSGFTIADGIAVKQPSELTMGILDAVLAGRVSVTDEEISRAIVLMLERAKLVVEGAGAVGVAAVAEGHVPGDGPVAIVLSGGNIDATLLINVMRHGLTAASRYLVVRTRVPDRPGELTKLLELVANERVNVQSVEHHREGMAIPIGETEVELTLAMRDEDHCAGLLDAMRRWGYAVERLR